MIEKYAETRSEQKLAREAEEARERAEQGRDRAESVLNDAMNSMPQGAMIVVRRHRGVR